MPFDLAYCAGVFSIFPYYKTLYNNADLQIAFGRTREVRKLAEVQSVALFSSIYTRATNMAPVKDGEPTPAGQLAGVVAAVFDYDIPNANPKRSTGGFVMPQCAEIVDNCGTGGDTIPTFHVSSSAALLAATNGVTVAKRGSPGNARRSGSSDFMDSIGIPTWNKTTPERIERAIDEAKLLL